MIDNNKENSRNGIQVIARAAAVLRVLRDHRGGLSLGQIASKVGLPRSTVQRIIGALATEKLVVVDGRAGGIRLGPELGAFAEAANFNIVDRCRSILNELVEETGETTDLAVLRGNRMVFLDQVPGRHRLRTVSSVGESFPLTNTANGRACLAMMPEENAVSLIQEEWDARNYRGDLNKLLTLLEDIRTSGLAYDLNEHSDGISAVGFGFKDWSGNWHAISIPVPSSRFDHAKPRVENALTEARHQVNEEFATSSGSDQVSQFA
ncbi:MAG: IclR family transcriptional regulator [Rhizobiaceae bacterium]